MEQETMTMVQVPERAGGDPSPMAGVPSADISLNPADFAAEMAKIEAAATAQTAPAPVVDEQPSQVIQEAAAHQPSEPVQPVQPQATATPPEVPQKFQDAEGKLDESKLAKSTVNVQEALQKYLDMEKELKRAQNAAKQQPQVPAFQTQQVINPGQAATFDQQIEADIKAYGIGPVLANLMESAKNAAYQEAKKDINGFEEREAERTSLGQLKALADSQPWVISPEGQAELMAVRKSNPWIDASPRPWEAAVSVLLGQKQLQGQNSQVRTPTPTAKTVTAPATPVNAANRAPSLPVVNINDKGALDAHLKKLNPAQQSEFFKRMGFPAF